MGRHISKKHTFVSEELLRRGFLREENGNLAVFASTFKDFVLEQSQRIAEKKKSLFSSLWWKRGKRT